MTARAGDVLGPYLLVRELGEDALGSLYLAERQDVRRVDLVKVLRPERAGDATAIELFFKQARASRKINQESVFANIEIADGLPVKFFSMELLRGQSLARVLAGLGGQPLPLPRALRVAERVAAGIAAAHDVDVIHHHIRPNNVFLAKRDRSPEPESVKVLDFGMAAIRSFEAAQSGPATIAGVPWYLAPEQLNRSAVDHRCDIYSFGILLFEMCTGRRPFDGSDIPKVVRQQLLVPPPSPSSLAPAPLPELLEAMILRCLSKDPARRPSSMMEVCLVLNALVESSGPVVPEAVPEEECALPGMIGRNSTALIAGSRAPQPASTPPQHATTADAAGAIPLPGAPHPAGGAIPLPGPGRPPAAGAIPLPGAPPRAPSASSMPAAGGAIPLPGAPPRVPSSPSMPAAAAIPLPGAPPRVPSSPSMPAAAAIPLPGAPPPRVPSSPSMPAAAAIPQPGAGPPDASEGQTQTWAPPVTVPLAAPPSMVADETATWTAPAELRAASLSSSPSLPRPTGPFAPVGGGAPPTPATPFPSNPFGNAASAAPPPVSTTPSPFTPPAFPKPAAPQVSPFPSPGGAPSSSPPFPAAAPFPGAPSSPFPGPSSSPSSSPFPGAPSSSSSPSSPFPGASSSPFPAAPSPFPAAPFASGPNAPPPFSPPPSDPLLAPPPSDGMIAREPASGTSPTLAPTPSIDGAADLIAAFDGEPRAKGRRVLLAAGVVAVAAVVALAVLQPWRNAAATAGGDATGAAAATGGAAGAGGANGAATGAAAGAGDATGAATGAAAGAGDATGAATGAAAGAGDATGAAAGAGDATGAAHVDAHDDVAATGAAADEGAAHVEAAAGAHDDAVASPSAPVEVEVAFASTPDGAVVLDNNGKRLGVTPCTVKMKPNPKAPEVKVYLKHAGFETATARVKVAEGATLSVTLKTARPRQAPSGDLINPFGK